MLEATRDMERTVDTLVISSSWRCRISNSLKMVKFCWNKIQNV